MKRARSRIALLETQWRVSGQRPPEMKSDPPGSSRRERAHLAAAAAARRFEAVLGDALRGQLGQNVVQVVGVRVAVARQVGHHLRFVVDTVPHHRVGFPRGAGRPHGEDEPTHPRHLQQLQNLWDGTEKQTFLRKV